MILNDIPESIRGDQPLLGFGIILLPSEMKDENYADLSAALVFGRQLFPDRLVGIRCHGWGGATDVVQALVDLIRTDGMFAGLALGSCDSGAAIVWASCANRYYYPDARVRIHNAANGESAMRWDKHTFYNRYEQIAVEDKFQAHILATASNKTSLFWRKRLDEGGELGFPLYAEDFEKYAMGFPIADAPPYLWKTFDETHPD